MGSWNYRTNVWTCQWMKVLHCVAKAYELVERDTEVDFDEMALRLPKSTLTLYSTNHFAMHESFIWMKILFLFEELDSWLGIVRWVTPQWRTAVLPDRADTTVIIGFPTCQFESININALTNYKVINEI